MKELFAAIFAKFNTVNDFKTAIGGRFYPYEAPQAPVFPYAVYSLVSDDPDFDFSDDHEEINVQFSIYSEESSVSQILDLFHKLKALFDNAKLSVTGWSLIRCQRSQSRLDRDIDMKTWGYTVEYDILLEKVRA